MSFKNEAMEEKVFSEASNNDALKARLRQYSSEICSAKKTTVISVLFQLFGNHRLVP